jgi:hypothetical protein
VTPSLDIEETPNQMKETMTMNSLRRGVMTAAIAGSLLAGGAVGATVFGAASSGAATATTQATTSAAGPTQSTPEGAPPSGTFRPIETAAHETKESAQREAEETAGKFPTTSP